MDAYYVDGVPLHDPSRGWYVMEGTELPSVAAPRIASVEVPTRDGVIAPRSLSHGDASLAVKMMLTGAGGGRAALASSFDALVRTLRATTEVTHFFDDGMPSRTAAARLSSISDPTYNVDTEDDDPDYEFSVVFDLPGGVWKEDAVIQAFIDDLTPFNGTGAPLQDVTLYMTPASRRIVITDGGTGASFRWEGDLVDGATLVVRPASCEAHWVITDAPYDCSGSLHMPQALWEITPTVDGIVTVQATGVDQVIVDGRRSFA